MKGGELDFFFAEPRVEVRQIPDKKSSAQEALRHLTTLQEIISGTSPESFREPENIKSAVWEYATKEGRAAVLWPLRYSLTGKTYSPDPFVVASIIGKEATLSRIAAAISLLKTV